MNIKKKILAYSAIVITFLVISYGFVPEVLGGKIVNQSDIAGYVGMAHEANTWNAEHPDDKTAWTDSMFGGMPTTMLTGNDGGDATQGIFDFFLTGKRPASYFFISLLGAFLLMLALGVSPLLAAGGAIAVTFCSYNLQIIQVGHNAKMLALAWAPWVLAGVIYTYRKALNNPLPFGWKGILASLLGPVLTAFALNFQIKANHVQITYYIGIIIVSYVLVLLVWLLLKKRELLKHFIATSALLVVFSGLGIATNANKLIPTWEYTKETMRGGSTLTADGSSSSKGLDLEYATQWSYGWEELPNLLIPNYNGGSSVGPVDPESSATINVIRKQYKEAGYRLSKSDAEEIAQGLPMYWGPQPFTAGPMYIGAITIFLFIMGLCLPGRRERWWLLIPSVIGIFLALGSNFMDFTRLWYEHMPFYSKFRTVSMALVILQFTMPMLAFIALDRTLKGKYNRPSVMLAGGIALAFTALFCLLCIIFPGIVGTFASYSDLNYGPALAGAFAQDRMSLMRSDAFTALVLILATAALIYWATLGNGQRNTAKRRIIAGMGICLLLAVNLLSVGKRYLNSSHFVTKSKFESHFTQKPSDKYILEDKALSYRVADLSTNIWNDATPSYWHKNIGGYSPVKLQRYQDLIDYYLDGEVKSVLKFRKNVKSAEEQLAQLEACQAALPELPILSALNCRYITLYPSLPPLVNEGALGNAWFVDSCVVADSPREEIRLIGEVPLGSTAVVEIPGQAGYDEALGTCSAAKDSVIQSNILLTEYAPNQLKYQYSTAEDRVAVFSEIWCPYGWKAWIENESGAKIADVPLFKADWALRAAVLPAGQGTLVMRFQPDSYAKGRAISAGASWLLILLLILAAAAPNYEFLRKLIRK